MKLVIFGLSITSSWGNGHAALWRGLCRALAQRGHQVHFFERDLPYYAGARDLTRLDPCQIHLYRNWESIAHCARGHVGDADVAIVTSYCPDAVPAAEIVTVGSAVSVFYDMDTPVTLARLKRGEIVEYLPPQGLSDFDLVLSYAGGRALQLLRSQLGATRVAPLYGWVDPLQHFVHPPHPEFQGDLSYIGTYSEDRQQTLEELLLEPARRFPEKRFVIAGAMYPHNFPWSSNIYFVRHLPPSSHGAFYCSSPLTLNVTRRAMVEVGYCPSGRLFEAAACGVPVLTDDWTGIEEFFAPGKEILIARDRNDTIRALEMHREQLAEIGRAAYERTIADHTADARAIEFEQLVGSARSSRPPADEALAT